MSFQAAIFSERNLPAALSAVALCLGSRPAARAAQAGKPS
jgi:hypothetical protein